MNRTPFYQHHIARGGKVIDFHGWELPVQYTSITQEHNAVRNNVGLFDISHMGQVYIWGRQALDYLQHLMTNNIGKAGVGKGIYTHMLTEKGGVIDDLFVFRLEDDKFLLIVNASRREADMTWLENHKKGFDAHLMEVPEGAGLALQGPKAVPLLEKLSPKTRKLGRHQIAEFDFGEVTAFVTRTGYTGEDGFELFAPAGHLLLIWDQLLSAGAPFGLQLCGLGARDTLRTEVAYPLYGQELDEDHTPLEAGLDWVVKFDKGPFIGRDALLEQKSKGLPSRLYGFKVESGGIARHGAQIFINQKKAGTVASGTFAPSLGYSIGMAYLKPVVKEEGAGLTVMQGSRELHAVTVPLPFLKKPVPTAK